MLEISINGGPFIDFITAGGSFMGGGYNGTISAALHSPIAGRAAWTGNSGGYIGTSAMIPPAAWGQNVVLRFRLATDCSGSSPGWRIDNVRVLYFVTVPVTNSNTKSDINTAPNTHPTPYHTNTHSDCNSDNHSVGNNSPGVPNSDTYCHSIRQSDAATDTITYCDSRSAGP